MIKFIHTGDIHLGLQFKNVSFNKEKAKERRIELWTTFERIVSRAKENMVDFLLIAGDLFEESYFTLGDMKRVRDTFKEAEKVNIIISAGNHDYIGEKSLYNKIDWSENVTIFNGNGIEIKEFPKLNTNIYGYSWSRTEMKENKLFHNFTEVDKERTNILVLHGDISINSSYLPLNIQELNKLNLDYIALGHIHKPQIISDKIAYSGCPEPLDFGEIGERGIIEGMVKDNKTIFEFIPFSKRIFINEEIILKEDMGYPQIINKIKNIDKGNKDRDFYRIILKGFIDKDVNFKSLTKDLEPYFYHIEIKDNTILDYDFDMLERDNQDNIIGQFIKTMRSKGLEDSIVKESLYIGLEALLKGRGEM
ncbi:exonuclease SbcCD subunit D [Tissierella sp. MSJ-40]|uniref:Exonuclease SbcCD subunit D n=1 Tax=Tissierella simiarum TaxID=2841534 RepID=A0ABS6E7P8_9FIRM|nr:exonuclease SbcCD subunit D [Tissierella simiarum]MBU5438943.1 exonuclease SbcCD subunit D [Tissierella simiarum]